MRAPWISIAVMVAACGTPAPTPPEKFRIISTPAQAGAALMEEELTAVGAVSAVGVSQAGNLVTVAGDRVFELNASVLVQRNLYAEGTDPTSLGTVTSVVPRAEGGAWLATSNGLFVVDSRYVTHSPVMAGMGPLSGASEANAGGLTGLWLAASNGIYRRQTDKTERYHVDGYAEEAKAVATDSDGVGALALLGTRLVLLTPGASGPAAEVPADDVGNVVAVAAGKGTLFAASDRGLFRWTKTATPAWTRFTLGEKAALDVRLDPVTGSAWVVTDGELLRVDGDAVTSFSRPAGTSLLAVDRLGDLWTAKAATLVRVKAGAGSIDSTFATDLKPWIQSNCAMCHADFTDIVAFAPKAEAALQRVRLGDMPRCTGGVPCPIDQHLKPEQYAVLEGWIRGGKQP